MPESPDTSRDDTHDEWEAVRRGEAQEAAAPDPPRAVENRSEPSGSTGAQPSAEARKLSAIALNSGWHGAKHPCSTTPCDECLADADRALDAAYAIDAPAIHAAGVREGRAAMLREVVEWMGARLEGDREESHCVTVNLKGFEARFPSEGS